MQHPWFISRQRNKRSQVKVVPMRPEFELLESRLAPAATRYPEFTLRDLHPSTPTSGQDLGPATFRGTVSGYYFTNPG